MTHERLLTIKMSQDRVGLEAFWPNASNLWLFDASTHPGLVQRRGSPWYDPGPSFIPYFFVDDISFSISSTVSMFADDTKVYREPSTVASKWQLHFNSERCEVLRTTHRCEPSLPKYSLGTSLKTRKCVKEFGIMVSSDLSWPLMIKLTLVYWFGSQNGWLIKENKRLQVTAIINWQNINTVYKNWKNKNI